PGAPRRGADDVVGEQALARQQRAHRPGLLLALTGEGALDVEQGGGVLRLGVSQHDQPTTHDETTVATMASRAMKASIAPTMTASPLIPVMQPVCHVPDTVPRSPPGLPPPGKGVAPGRGAACFPARRVVDWRGGPPVTP